MGNKFQLIGLVIAALFLCSCTFNPFTTDNKLTGSPVSTTIGAAAGGGAAALFHGSTPAIAASAIGGGLIGYYMSTLRFASGGVMQACGKVFTLGDYLTVEIPSDQLFEVNTAVFLDDANPILDSVVNILSHYPDNNILISGNTSGFGTTCFQLRLSETRARQVAAYLWSHGVSQFKNFGMRLRHLIYTGYGNFFPIANDLHNCSNRKNSRIQITAYPNYAELKIDHCFRVFGNIGAMDEDPCLPRNC